METELKVNIKGEWIEYDYSINCSHLIIQKILDALEKNGRPADYIGKSKAIKVNGIVRQLKVRTLFFKFKDADKI